MTERSIKCWFCKRRVRLSFSADISLCQACHLFFQRITLQQMKASFKRRFQLWLSVKAYQFSMKLSLHPIYDR